MGDWLVDEATNQTRFRAINESIEHMTDALNVHELRDVYVCECGDGDCQQPISMTRAEYEGVRAESTFFAIALDHENPEIDRLVSEYERYAVVQKTFRMAVRIARETDPRGQFNEQPGGGPVTIELPQPPGALGRTLPDRGPSGGRAR